ncbi:erythroid differentiation-related factor 1-like [Ruditapes philippinarum]|uniref:erythroid differentiation-related factor 1-like n=1 Tax=Ruditapes philippinarum TaxID=129788 RepID=UPI00295C1B1B|nr:erythroid differentiation-related factor 1-like [Ruditapes philippinarum]
MAEKLKEQTDNQLVPVSYGPSKAVVPLKEVRSDAEVKHGIVHFSTHIAPLRLHTNLNIPPSNWLRSSSKLEQHVHDLTWRSSRKPSEFSSIDMSHKSPDLAGEVDVITHAANIKKLLKIPFENSHISMMVHRVGKSLLLDEFDIHKHLLRKEQTEWAWLRQFYYEYVLDNMKCVPRQSKSRDNLQNRNMYSKFLYHSLCESAESGVCMINQGLMSNEDKTVIPDPLPKAAGSQTHRDVLWTFEDIKMLIGTDLPVFCDDSYCVSLRLSDMRTPVNVLTGLDYWLDNLMCNVPEVAMCFHVNGIVQKYEIVKTEDIPHLENSRFDPTVVTDIAKNILSFLKTNATKEGHTYWLYKGTNDDVVKLYDLTTVCSDMEKNFSEQNPFTVPLGMLLYRVARKMWTDQKLAKTALIRTLLENCLCLLDEKKHSQVCTSASYLLSDIYVPDKSLDDDWSLPIEAEEEENGNEEQGQDTEEVKEMSNSVDVKTLSERSSRSRSKELVRMKPFNETVDERCTEAVKCIHKGLACLEYDLKVGSHKQSHIVEEQAKCDSDTAIPLHYEPLKKTAATDSPVLDTGRSSRTGDLQMTSFNKEGDEQPEGQTWHHLSKGLLYRKAAMTFSAMARGCMNKAEYIEAVKYLKLAMYSLNAMKVVIPHKVSENSALLSNLMGLCGDIRLVVTQSHHLEIDWDTTWKSSPTEETAILEMAEKEFESFEYEGIFKFGCSVLDSLTVCINCYREAIDLISKKKGHVYLPLCKRKGNCLNELGVFYMQSAQKLLETEVIIDKPSPEMMTCWVKGRQAFSEGIEVFEKIEDIANQALLHCNCGRLMRLCATTYTQIALKSEKQEFTPNERHYFQLIV